MFAKGPPRCTATVLERESVGFVSGEILMPSMDSRFSSFQPSLSAAQNLCFVLGSFSLRMKNCNFFRGFICEGTNNIFYLIALSAEWLVRE